MSSLKYDDQWLKFTDDLLSKVNHKGKSLSPYGLMILAEYVSRFIQSEANVLPEAKNENLLASVESLVGPSFPFIGLLKEKILPLNDDNIKTVKDNLNVALRGMITPQVEVAEDEVYFASAISVDFNWDFPFQEMENGLMSKNVTSITTVTENEVVCQELKTDSGLLIEVFEAKKGFEELGKERIALESYNDQYPGFISGHSALQMNLITGFTTSYTAIMKPWKQETKWEDINGMLPVIFNVPPALPSHLNQIIAADFSAKGYKAAALSEFRAGRSLSAPTNMAKNFIMNWSQVDHYCVCSDPSTGAILFVSYVEKDT